MAGENILLYSVGSIRRLALRTPVDIFRPGDGVLESFSLLRPHVDGAEQGRRAGGAAVES